MSIQIVFSDVGGVLLNNGWDKEIRQAAADKFDLDMHEMQMRHEMVFEDYERGKLLLEEYLQHVVFFKQRNFSMPEFIRYMFNTSIPHQDMIALLKQLKQNFQIQIGVLSNEGREIATNRFDKFEFKTFVDVFVVSGWMGVRKPDLRIFKLALGMAQTDPANILYIDDRLPLVEIGARMGFCSIHHRSYAETQDQIRKFF
jgi:putative hydrolase of the HAD superfamily